MLGNREVSIRINKASTGNDADVSHDEAIFEDRVAFVHTIVTDTIKNVFVGVCVYVALDTVRQVLIARNTKFLQY